MKVGVFAPKYLQFFLFLTGWWVSAPAFASVDFSLSKITSELNRGEPGCLGYVRAKAVSDTDAKRLTPECQRFRNLYLASLKNFSENTDEYEASLKKAIESSVKKKSHAPPYYALLFALYTDPFGAENTILSRAQFELKNKLLFQYGVAALQRIQMRKCVDFPQPAYDEICRSNDPFFARLRGLVWARKEAK